MTSPGSSSSPDAESLFDEYLVRLEDSDEEDFESFVAEHPVEADELRRLHDDWSRLDARLESALPEPVPQDALLGSQSVRLLGNDASGEWIDAKPGQVIADFRLVRRIGKGGMGEVWEAEQISLRRPVALKLIRPGRHGESTARLTMREARAGGRPDHPGLVAVYAAGTADGVPYIAQQLVGDGFSLADLIARMRDAPRRTPEDYRSIAQLFVDIADSVQAAHAAGILHRDLKPQNILIGPDDRPRVTDFGLAHSTTDARGAARPGLVGTYPYMSPEQAGGKDIEIDSRSDVFSLGAVLYETLTLRRAFEGDTGPQIVERVMNAEPPDPRSIRSQIPLDLAVISMKALAKNRGNRYASMQDLADDLRRFLANEPIHAKPQGYVSRSWKWAQRHPAWTTAFTLVNTALVVIFVLLLRSVELRHAANRQTIIAEANRDLAVREAAEAVRQAYLANIRAAALHLEGGRHEEARRQLALCAEDQRDWEWSHYALRADSAQLRLAHSDDVLAVAVSSDGRLVATGDRQGAVRLWRSDEDEPFALLSIDAPAGALEVEPPARAAGDRDLERAVHSLVLADAGEVVVAGFGNGSTAVWDVRTGALRGLLEGHLGAVRAVAVSADGRRVVSGSDDGTFRRWDQGEDGWTSIEGLVSNGGVVSLAMTADGRRFVTGSRFGPVFVRDATTGEELLRDRTYLRPEKRVAMNSDGSRIVTGADDGRVVVLDGWTGELLVELPEQRFAIGALAVSGDGRRIAVLTPEDNAIHIWSGDTGRRLATLTGHGRLVTSLAMSRDGSRIVAGSTDDLALVWDGDTADALVELPGQATVVSSLDVSDDGRCIVGASVQDQSVSVWDGVTGALHARLGGHRLGVTTVAVSGDGSTVASAGYAGSVRLWDLPAGTFRDSLSGHGSSVTSVALDHTGRHVVTGSHDRTVRVWDAVSGEPLAAFAGLGAVATSVDISADGSRVACASEEGSVRIWDWQEGYEVGCVLREGLGQDDGTVVLDRDGSRVAWASVQADVVHLWDVDTGELLQTMTGHRSGIAGVALGPGGRRVVTASERDDTLRLWDGRSGEPLATLTGATSFVTAVAMSADGRRIVAGAADGSLRIWESDLAAALDLWRGAASRQ